MPERRWCAERSGMGRHRFRSAALPERERAQPEACSSSASDATMKRTYCRRSGRACLRSAGFAWLLSYFPPSPSHSPPRTWPAPSTLFLLSLGGKIFDHFAKTFDPGRVVDLLPEHHGGGRNANDFTVEYLVSYFDQIALVVRAVDHRQQALLLGHDQPLELDFVDGESRRSGRPLFRLDLRLGPDQRLERVAPSLRIVVIGLRGARFLEDFLKALLHVLIGRGRPGGRGRRGRRRRRGCPTARFSAGSLREGHDHHRGDDQQRKRESGPHPLPPAGFAGAVSFGST